MQVRAGVYNFNTSPQYNILKIIIYSKVTATHTIKSAHQFSVYFICFKVSFCGTKASLQIQPKLILQSKSKKAKILACQKIYPLLQI